MYSVIFHLNSFCYRDLKLFVSTCNVLNRICPFTCIQIYFGIQDSSVNLVDRACAEANNMFGFGGTFTSHTASFAFASTCINTSQSGQKPKKKYLAKSSD